MKRDTMTIMYSPAKKCLAYIGQAAGSDFWDGIWAVGAETEQASKSVNAQEVVEQTLHLLPGKGRKIIEAGCGNGGIVLALSRAGYKVSGVDFAEQTVSRLNKSHPDLDIILDDVRDLSAPDASYDGYWSLGVIEHFWNGNDAILDEAVRVLRPGGIMFLTFPSMSPLRRLRTKLGAYPSLPDKNDEPKGFYQFALRPAVVRKALEDRGMSVLIERRRNAVLGLADDFPDFASFITKSRTPVARIARLMATKLATQLCGHGTIMILRKED